MDGGIRSSLHQEHTLSSVRTGKGRVCIGTGEHAFLEFETAHWGSQRQRPQYDDARGWLDSALRTEGEDVAWLRTVDNDLDVIFDVVKNRTVDTPRSRRFVQMLFDGSFAERTRNACENQERRRQAGVLGDIKGPSLLVRLSSRPSSWRRERLSLRPLPATDGRSFFAVSRVSDVRGGAVLCECFVGNEADSFALGGADAFLSETVDGSELRIFVET